MSNVALFWMCRACNEGRPDAWISVAKRRIVVDRGESIDLTACYCNDRPRCLQEMPKVLDAMAKHVINGFIAPRVHLLWQGSAICDPHKRWPEDFPEGSKWISLMTLDPAVARDFVNVTCQSCRAVVIVCPHRVGDDMPDRRWRCFDCGSLLSQRPNCVST